MFLYRCYGKIWYRSYTTIIQSVQEYVSSHIFQPLFPKIHRNLLTFFSHYFPEYIRTYLCFTSSLDTSTPLGADILLDRLYDGSIRSVSNISIKGF
jgi:hypothetical protein